MKRCLLSPPKHHILLGMRLDTAIQRDLTNQNEDLAKDIYCLCVQISHFWQSSIAMESGRFVYDLPKTHGACPYVC